jgi:TPR repeat protein
MNAPSLAGEVDPSQASTWTEFGTCLRKQRGAAGLSLCDMETATAVDSLGLTRSTMSDVENGRGKPRPDWLAVYLTQCGVPSRRQRIWKTTRATIAAAESATAVGPVRLPRVRECSPRRLGVHPSIAVDPDGPALPVRPLPELPRYVARNVDDEVREALADAAGNGGLVVLVGGSSTGKTRTAYEAINAELGGWWLLDPTDGADLIAAQDTGTLSRGGLVVWLDEFQRYLTGTDALTVGVVRQLLDPRHPAVVVATMWPQWYDRFTIAPSADQGEDPYRHARQILTTMARIIRLSDFTDNERDRAQALARDDDRLRVALQDPHFGPTQVLAAAPQLVDRWLHASDPYAKALITAAIDYRHLDYRGPLTTDLLRDAVADYLTERQFATAPADWFTSAVRYATAELRGAASALIPLASPTMGTPAGYTVADYLLQHGEAVRSTAASPQSLWDSAVTHVTDPDDRTRLGWAAESRHLSRYAALLFEAAANDGVTFAMRGLARVLQAAGRTGDAATWLHRAVHEGDSSTDALARGLEQAGHLDESEGLLARSADAGDPEARYQLAKLLDRHGRPTEASAAMRQAADAGYPAAVSRVADSLWLSGQPNEAIELLRRAIGNGDDSTAAVYTRSSLVTQLAEVYTRRGQRSEARAVLGEAARTGDTSAMKALANLLLESSDPEDVEHGLAYLRQVALEGDPSAMRDLASGLRLAGRDSEADTWLRHAAWAGNPSAIEELSSTLPSNEAIGWLKENGSADAFALTKLAELMDQSAAIAWLREASEKGNTAAMETLIWVLRESGQVSEAEKWLRIAAEAGEIGALTDLANLLEQAGREKDAARLRRYGIDPGGRTAKPWH